MKRSLTAIVAAAALLVTHQVGTAEAGDHGKKKDIVEIAMSTEGFGTLVAAVKAADLVEVLQGEGPFTVFAPTDEAFAKLPEGTLESLLGDKEALTRVLTYHVVPGKVMAEDVAALKWAETAQGQAVRIQVSDGSVTIDGAKVVATDVKASNGVIHVIDTVILPRKNIVETARAGGKFQTLLAAAEAAGVAEVLAGGGPFTVFAPTDEAFSKLPAGTVESLLSNPAELKSILTYHVVPGRVLASDITENAEHSFPVETVQGGSVNVRVESGGVMVDNANVTATDIIAGNGVIHVIDSVITPPSTM